MHLHLDINRVFLLFLFFFILFSQTKFDCCSTAVWDDKEYMDLKVEREEHGSKSQHRLGQLMDGQTMSVKRVQRLKGNKK